MKTSETILNYYIELIVKGWADGPGKKQAIIILENIKNEIAKLASSNSKVISDTALTEEWCRQNDTDPDIEEDYIDAVRCKIWVEGAGWYRDNVPVWDSESVSWLLRTLYSELITGHENFNIDDFIKENINKANDFKVKNSG